MTAFRQALILSFPPVGPIMSVDVAPNIPSRKALNALANYMKSVVPDANADEIVLLADDSTFGSGKRGFVLTERHLIMANPQAGVSLKDELEAFSCSGVSVEILRRHEEPLRFSTKHAETLGLALAAFFSTASMHPGEAEAPPPNPVGSESVRGTKSIRELASRGEFDPSHMESSLPLHCVFQILFPYVQHLGFELTQVGGKIRDTHSFTEGKAELQLVSLPESVLSVARRKIRGVTLGALLGGQMGALVGLDLASSKNDPLTLNIRIEPKPEGSLVSITGSPKPIVEIFAIALLGIEQRARLASFCGLMPWPLHSVDNLPSDDELMSDQGTQDGDQLIPLPEDWRGVGKNLLSLS